MRTILVDKNDQPVKVGDEVADFRGDKMTIVGWAAPPQYSGSTGRIFVSMGVSNIEHSFYPSVCNLKFKEVE